MAKTILTLAMVIIGCTFDPYTPPHASARLINPAEQPDFIDDLDLEGLSIAVQRQLPVLRTEPIREALRIGSASYSTQQLLASLERLSKLLAGADACMKAGTGKAQCTGAFANQVRDQFLVYRLQPALLSAYYTPTIEVATQPTGKFRYPIYRTPDTARERRFSREDIDFLHKLDGKGYELFYAADRFDLYVMGIEGGARLLVNDEGRRYTKYLHYDADNKMEFTDLSEYMATHGLLTPNNVSRLDQRSVIATHPGLEREIFSSCPGYVFFKTSDAPIISNTGATLTVNRSLASDPAYYPVKGLFTFVVAPLPMPPAEGTPPESNPAKVEYRMMRRFFIDQDIGHHITGPARFDLFFGEGVYAEFLANNFMTRGSIYLLILK